MVQVKIVVEEGEGRLRGEVGGPEASPGVQLLWLGPLSPPPSPLAIHVYGRVLSPPPPISLFFCSRGGGMG